MRLEYAICMSPRTVIAELTPRRIEVASKMAGVRAGGRPLKGRAKNADIGIWRLVGGAEWGGKEMECLSWVIGEGLVSALDVVQTLHFNELGLKEMNPIAVGIYDHAVYLSLMSLGFNMLGAALVWYEPRLCKVYPVVMALHVGVISNNDRIMQERGWESGLQVEFSYTLKEW